MSSLFGGGSTPNPAPEPTAPAATEKSTQNAANSEKVRLMRAMGRQSSLLSGQGENPGTGGKKTTTGA